MGISSKLAELNWQRNQTFAMPFTLENARPALFAYDGDVYEGLDAYSLSETQIDKLQGSLTYSLWTLWSAKTIRSYRSLSIGDGHQTTRRKGGKPLCFLERKNHSGIER